MKEFTTCMTLDNETGNNIRSAALNVKYYLGEKFQFVFKHAMPEVTDDRYGLSLMVTNADAQLALLINLMSSSDNIISNLVLVLLRDKIREIVSILRSAVIMDAVTEDPSYVELVNKLENSFRLYTEMYIY